MAEDLVLQPMGLFTDPSPKNAVPNGGLTVASNVVLRAAGRVEPRPGFLKVATTSPPSSAQIVRLLPYRGDFLALGRTGADTYKTTWLSDDSTLVTDGSSDLAWEDYRIFAATARKNLYLNTTDCIRKLTAPGTDTTAERAGYEATVNLEPLSPNSPGTAIPTTEFRAYRATIERKDANDVTVVSRPSGRLVYENDTGATVDPIINANLPSSALAGDIVRLYGSNTAAGTPDDDLFEIDAIELDATDITNGFVQFTDDLADGTLGAVLYTSPSQEGLGQQNDPPPLCKAMAYFKTSMFYANTTGPQRTVLTLDEGGNSLATVATGIGERVYSITLTSGSAVATLADTTGLEVGMVVPGSTFNGSAVVRVVSIVVNTSVTFSETANVSTTGNVSFYDSVRVGSDYYNINTVEAFIKSFNSGDTTVRTTANANYFAVAVGDADSYQASGTATDEKNISILIEARKPSNAAVEVFATHGGEYKPNIPLPTTGSGKSTEQDALPHGIYWSKGDQPDHVPPDNFLTVGSETDEILNITATRDALWIFKRDGVFRLTGPGPATGWRVDPIDPELFIRTPYAADHMHESIFAWTNQGVVRVSGAGYELISDPAIGIDLRNEQRNTAIWEDPAEVDNGIADPIVANPKDNEIIFGRRTRGSTNRLTTLVYNLKTQSWVQWSLPGFPTAFAVDTDDQTIHYSQDTDDWQVRQERDWSSPLGTDTLQGLADEQYAITITDQTGDTVTIAGGSGWTPAVGDAVKATFSVVHVAAVTSATVFDVYPGQVANVAAATAYVAFESDIQTRGLAEAGPPGSARKRYSRMAWDLSGSAGFLLRQANLSVYRNDIGSGEVTAIADRPISDPTVGSDNVWAFVPRAAARRTDLRAGIKIRQALTDWSLGSFSVSYDAGGERWTQ